MFASASSYVWEERPACGRVPGEGDDWVWVQTLTEESTEEDTSRGDEDTNQPTESEPNSRRKAPHCRRAPEHMDIDQPQENMRVTRSQKRALVAMEMGMLPRGRRVKTSKPEEGRTQGGKITRKTTRMRNRITRGGKDRGRGFSGGHVSWRSG
ncbi:uncharacterized protein LOC116616307 isoform X2 [Nematostella vectensis]|uniref:uncharacterized protein LOC116616307 isoform X2 n=1 Tax=Nematostella vectensis TaxID=45351 RepID=UPI00138FEBBD|nr:uncharacterized protein LOC116616307 isoform X2 [Nematostella vectensis]